MFAMIRSLLILSLLPLLAFAVNAQEQAANCPHITVSGPSGFPPPGEPYRFTAEVKTKNAELLPTLRYVWNVSPGTISKGQGTLAIEVSLQQPTPLTATLEVIGLPYGCSTSASETVIICLAPTAIKLDEFTVPIFQIEPSRIERIRTETIAQPSAQLYVHVSVGGNGDAKTRQDDFLQSVTSAALDASRITFVNVHSAAEFIRIWLVPAGASPPTCENCGKGVDDPANARSCPAITVLSPAEVVAPGESGHFRATVNPPQGDLAYTWTLQGAADIVSGQGSADLQFQMREFDLYDYELPIKATLNINGLPAGCPFSVSETYALAIDPSPVILGEISKPPYRLDTDLISTLERTFAIHSSSQIYIIVYAKGADTNGIVRNIKKQVSDRKLDISRLTFITSEQKFTKVSVFLVPPGSTPPAP